MQRGTICPSYLCFLSGYLFECFFFSPEWYFFGVEGDRGTLAFILDYIDSLYSGIPRKIPVSYKDAHQVSKPPRWQLERESPLRTRTSVPVYLTNSMKRLNMDKGKSALQDMRCKVKLKKTDRKLNYRETRVQSCSSSTNENQEEGEANVEVCLKLILTGIKDFQQDNKQQLKVIKGGISKI